MKWQATRSAIHQTSSHGRGIEFAAEAAFDDDGSLLAVKADGLADIGGYVSSHVHMLTTVFCVDLIPGQYDLLYLHARVRGALTNATPLDSFRGVHEVPAMALIERLMEEGAKEVGMDPAELRRRNQIQEEQFPYESVTGQRYDSGNYRRALDKALEAVDYEELRERQDQLREEGRHLGIGLSCYAHVSGVGPADVCKRAGIFKTHWESGRITIHQSGTVTAYCGTQDFGMGHQTVYAQIISDELGIPIEDIEVIEGDTRQLNDGTGTHASRSLVVGGSALVESARDVIEKTHDIAAHHLEASEEDVAFEDGEFRVAGAPDRSMTIQDVANEIDLGTLSPLETDTGGRIPRENRTGGGRPRDTPHGQAGCGDRRHAPGRGVAVPRSTNRTRHRLRRVVPAVPARGVLSAPTRTHRGHRSGRRDVLLGTSDDHHELMDRFVVGPTCSLLTRQFSDSTTLDSGAAAPVGLLYLVVNNTSSCLSIAHHADRFLRPGPEQSPRLGFRTSHWRTRTTTMIGRR